MEELSAIVDKRHQAYLWARVYSRFSDLMGFTVLPSWDISTSTFSSLLRSILRRKLPSRKFIDCLHNDLQYLRLAYSQGDQYNHYIERFFTGDLRFEIRLDLEKHLKSNGLSESQPSTAESVGQSSSIPDDISSEVKSATEVKTLRKRRKKGTSRVVTQKEKHKLVFQPAAEQHFAAESECDIIFETTQDLVVESIEYQTATVTDIIDNKHTVVIEKHEIAIDAYFKDENCSEFMSAYEIEQQQESSVHSESEQFVSADIKESPSISDIHETVYYTRVSRRMFVQVMGISGSLARRFIDCDFRCLRQIKNIVFRVTGWPCHLIKRLIYALCGFTDRLCSNRIK